MALHLHSEISSLFLFHACLIPILFLAYPALSDPLYDICDTNGNYTLNSTYESNLANLLLPSLSSNASALGFYSSTVGKIPYQVYGIALCRGDANATACRSCLDVATKDVLQLCPYNKGGIIWYDMCFLRYSNQDFLSSIDNSKQVGMMNTQNITEPNMFDKLVAQLMDKIFQYAAFNSSKKFATGEANFTTDVPKIYGMSQCTSDLSKKQCYDCLRDVFKWHPRFAGKEGGRVLGVRCNMRYEIYSFYDGKSKVLLASPFSKSTNTTGILAPPPAATAGGGGNKKNVLGMVLAIAIPLVVAAAAISIICICFWRRRFAKKVRHETNREEILDIDSILFDLSTLRSATANFCDENKLGEGGFGAVYKGTLHDGRDIAVKRLSKSSGQGIGELKNELVLVAKLQHRNLVRLLGVCLEEQEKLLVYEYVPNRSLDTIMFDSIRRNELNWGRRYKIIGGIARGLLYLHEDSRMKIIHRDLKASNILLDEQMNPKISDFGLARLFAGDQTQGTTSRVVGTFGYMSPEYAMHGLFSVKSDVFSFGVLVLEIVTGRKNSHFLDSEHAEDLLSYIWEHWTKGTIAEILDPSLREHCPRSEVLRCIQMGLLCVQEDPGSRPTMSMVVLMLNSYSVSLQAPSKPAFCVGMSGLFQMDPFKGYSLSTDSRGTQKSNPMTSNELSISELDPR